MTATAHAGNAPTSPFGLRLIGGFKAASALLLFLIGLKLLNSVNLDLHNFALKLATWIKFDPHNHRIESLIETISGIPTRKLHLYGVGTMLYALMYATEGIGLLLKKPWAEWLTVILTGLFIPVEVYEVFHHNTAAKTAVLILNVAIVAYLVMVVYKRKKAERAERATAAPQPA